AQPPATGSANGQGGTGSESDRKHGPGLDPVWVGPEGPGERRARVGRASGQRSVGPPLASCLCARGGASSVVSRGRTRPSGAISDGANSTVVFRTIRPRQQIGATRAVESQTVAGGEAVTQVER